MYDIPNWLSINDMPNFGILLIHVQEYDAYKMYIIHTLHTNQIHYLFFTL